MAHGDPQGQAVKTAWSYMYDVMDEILFLSLIVIIYCFNKEGPS